jgi:HPr kinase/phosphorylase
MPPDGPGRAGPAPPPSRLLHASCVEIDAAAVIVRGASGSGKSDLCLRLIDAGGRLVADDQVRLERAGDGVLAAPPTALAGLLEVRGVGILRLPHVAPSRVRLVVDLAPRGEIPRLPERHESTCELLGVRLQRLDLDPFAVSACAKVGVALRAERVH